MAVTDIASTKTTDYSGSLTEVSVLPVETEVNEFIPEWNKWHGYYREIPVLQALIDKKAMWTAGKGFKSDEKTKEKISKIKGHGKDTFNTILFNAIRTKTICGDFFAEIIKGNKKGLINLKPLDPGTIRITANNLGIIEKYEQISQKSVNQFGKAVVLNSWKPNEIFHLSHNRIADEIHGISTIEKIEKTILKWKEAMDDMQVVFHRYAKPLWVFTVDTDDQTKIAQFTAELNNSLKKSENLVVPTGTVTNYERLAIPQFSTLDPLPWMKYLERYFLISEGVPEVVLGRGEEQSEATAKIVYLAWQQVIEWEQLYIQEQVKAQLDLEIELEFPASIDPSLLTDARKNTGDSVKNVVPKGGEE